MPPRPEAIEKLELLLLSSVPLRQCVRFGMLSVIMITPIHLVLVHPEIPHNTGAIGRVCVGLGCPLHLIRPLGFHLSEQYLKRAGLDYWEHLDLHVYDNWQSFLDAVKPSRTFFLSTRGTQSLYDCEFASGDALVFGSETRGLPQDFYARYQDQLFKIPMPGEHARSINLANAVSITAYEAFRQISGTRR